MTKTPVNPFFAWTAVALKSSEMMMASAQVVSHRTNQMMNAGMIPNAKDQTEFNLMGQEKMEAAGESMMAMTNYMMSLNHQIGTQFVSQMLNSSSDILSLATSRTPAEAFERQAKLMTTLSDCATQASNMSSQAAEMTQRGMKPVHSRAVANAKRLGKT